MDDATIRAALAGVTDATGASLLGDDALAESVRESDWLAVVLRRDDLSRETLRAIHARLSGAFPGVTVELHAGAQTYRGGDGFGVGRQVIAIVGGKGGVGKSTLSVNLALTLAAMGARVGLLDGDLNAPDVPHMLGVHQEQAPRGLGWRVLSRSVTPPAKRLRPYQRYGLELMSAGFVVPERLPPALTGRVYLTALLRYLVFGVNWQADLLLIDAPPGTGEELQVMANDLPLTGALFVTTPQDLAQMDAERTLTLLERAGVPIIGAVQNMAALTCPHCNEPIDMFARSSRLEAAGVPVVGRIPFDVQLSAGADSGRPLVLGDPRGPVAREFARLGMAVRTWLAERG